MTPNAAALREVDESTLLPALRAGDEQAFQRLTDRYHRELLVHCYRMLGSSFEAYSYFDTQAQAITRATTRNPGPAGFAAASEAARQLRWGGQLSLSMLWSLYAGLMTAAGFRLQLRAWRVAGLALFGLTLVKGVLLDIAELREFYRIIALLALGVVLLVVAWKYQRGLRREQAR